MSELADNDLQREALQKLGERTTALREGLAKLINSLLSSSHFTNGNNNDNDSYYF